MQTETLRRHTHSIVPLQRVAFLGVTTAAILGLSGCGILGQLSRATESRSLAATSVPGESLRVTTDNGHVSVTVEPGRTDVQVDAKLTATGSSHQEALDRLAQLTVIVDHAEGNVLDISIDYGTAEQRNSDGCSFEIRLPAVAGVSVNTRNGSIKLTDTVGAADLHTTNGHITVVRHDGPLLAKTSNGSVIAENVSGKVDIKTSNGHVTYIASPEAAQPFSLRTTNGTIQITIPTSIGGRINATTSNGSIKLAGSASENIKIEGTTKNRTLTLSDQTDHEDSIASTSNGSIIIQIDNN